MRIEEQEVLHIARLARIELKGDELARYTRDLNAILDYVAKLNELNTDDVEPTYHVRSLRQPLRADRAEEPLDRGQALANAPAHDDESFIVPLVL